MLSKEVTTRRTLVATDLPYPVQTPEDRFLALGGQPWEFAWPSTDHYYQVVREIVPKAREMLALIEQALPDSLTTPLPGVTASIWEGMRDGFAYRTIAPLLARKQFIVETAHRQQVTAIATRERVGSLRWWNGLASVGEAAQAAADELGLPYRGGCGATRRALRRWLVGPMGNLRALYELLHQDRPPKEMPVQREPDVMFLAHGPTVVPIIAAVGRALRDEHGLTSLAVDFQPGGMADQFRQAQVPHCAATSLLAPHTSRIAWSWLCRWQGIMRSFHQQANELRLSDALLAAIETRLTYTLAAYLPRAVWHSLLAGAVLDHIAPKSVVTLHLPGNGHAMHAVVVEAQKRGLPTVLLQHGVMGTQNAITATLPYQRVLVFHQPAVELLSGKGPAPDPEIVGSCLYDDISTSQTSRRDEGYVLVASQSDEHIERRRSPHSWLAAIFDTCSELGRHVILKIHPADARNMSYYQRLVEQTEASVRIVPHGEEGLSDLIAGCSLFISRFSATLLDAVLAGKPAVMVNFTGQPNPYPFPRLGAVLGVYTPDELRATLRKLLEQPAARAALDAVREDYIAYHIGPTDGQAAHRTAAALAECVAESQ